MQCVTSTYFWHSSRYHFLTFLSWQFDFQSSQELRVTLLGYVFHYMRRKTDIFLVLTLNPTNCLFIKFHLYQGSQRRQAARHKQFFFFLFFHAFTPKYIKHLKKPINLNNYADELILQIRIIYYTGLLF